MRTTLTHWCAIPALALSAFGAQAQDAFLTNLGIPRYAKTNTNYNIQVHVENSSSTNVMSFHVDWRLNGGSWNTGATINVSGGLQDGGYYMDVTHPVPMNIPAQGVQTLDVTVVSPGDINPGNNTTTVVFTTLTSWAPKVVLLEARTETWCPQCPPSNDVTNELMAVPEYAVAKFHLSDALDQCPECIAYYNQFNINYTPAGLVEMGDYNAYAINSQYPGWGSAMAGRAQGVSPLQLVMTSQLDWTTRVLTVTLEGTFTYPVTGGEFKMNVYAMENLVPGPQENASPGYIHNRVMRGMLGGASGTTGVIPASPVVGTTYSHTYTYTVPSGFKLADLKLIGLVEQDLGIEGRATINAVKSSASPVGITEETISADRLVVFPNPFQQDLAVIISGLSGKARTELVALDGRLMDTRTVILNGSAPTRLDLGAGLQAGAYLLRMITEKGTIERTVMKVD